MALFRNPIIQSLGGQPVSLRGTIMVPFAQGLNALFQEFRTATNPAWPPADFMAADKITKDFAVWCHTAKGYTVVSDEDVVL